MSFAKLEEFIFAKMSETKLPGLSAAIVKGGEVVWAKAFGFRDLECGLAATSHTLYGIGSVTKSFTALSIMQLAEQGKLRLDDPVGSYMPIDIKPGGEAIRISHLMSHSSGIPALAYAEAVIRGATGAGENWFPIASCADLLTFMADAQGWTLTRPGERWFYLNEGYALLGYIIEKCSGMPYEKYVHKHVLAPLGMERSFFCKDEVEKDQDAATPYIITRDGERKPSTYPYGGISSDGALISSVLDLSRYVAMYLGWGEHGGVRLLSRKSVEAMETPQVALPYQGPFGKGSYGYGLSITPDFLGHKLVGHGGSVLVATAYIGFIPEQGVGIALLANGSGYLLSQLGMYGLAILLEKDPESLPFVQMEKALTELVGTYETYRGTMKAQVKRMGDFLTIEIKDKYSDLTVPLVPEAIEENTRTFFTLESGIKLPVEFRVNKVEIDLIYERYRLRRTGKLL
ncbi:MAG: serine hydrolase [Dehalococcoidia bacterium]|nr:putative penicillin-binding protein PbpX [Chloroflexota bacterium]MBT9161891.1 putative penicillin-binding protein PbpX [Chloroflexota bacterium]